MTTAFESDVTSAREALDTAREELLAVVTSISDADIERARRGGWTVARVLQHVIQADWLYAGAVGYLNDRAASASRMRPSAPQSTSEAREQLEASGGAFRAALEGVTEDAFYAVKPVGHEEYSVLSLLENVAHHDREHAGQIREILASA